MSLEYYGISDAILKVTLSAAIAIIPAALVLIAALRAGQGVASAARGFARAIYSQIDETPEQMALAKLLHTNPELIDELSHLVELAAKIKADPVVKPDGSWQAVATIGYTPPVVEAPAQEVNVGDTAK